MDSVQSKFDGLIGVAVVLFVLVVLETGLLILPTRQLDGSAFNTAILDYPPYGLIPAIVILYQMSQTFLPAVLGPLWVLLLFAITALAMTVASIFVQFRLLLDCPSGFVDPANNTTDLNQAQLFACNHQHHLLVWRVVLSFVKATTATVLAIMLLTLGTAARRYINEIRADRNSDRDSVLAEVEAMLSGKAKTKARPLVGGAPESFEYTPVPSDAEVGAGFGARARVMLGERPDPRKVGLRAID